MAHGATVTDKGFTAQGRGSQSRKRTRLIAGRNAALAAVRVGHALEVVIERGAQDSPKVHAIVDAARTTGIPIRLVERCELDRLAGDDHQGVIAIAAAGAEPRLKDVLAWCTAEGRRPCVVMLRELLHEHNLGAILRTSDAAGADAIIVPTHGAAPLGREAVRVSTGASETVPVIRQSLTQAAAALRREGVTLIGAEPEAQQEYWNQDMTGAVAFVLGGEDRSLSQPLRDACDALVRIPMVGRVTSLNVSVACALLLYERRRQVRAQTQR
jgi:23S rRNA (guanosine2251-2'-O)-methyltransferase